MTDRTPVIGIAPLNPSYRLVSQNTLASFELHQARTHTITRSYV